MFSIRKYVVTAVLIVFCPFCSLFAQDDEYNIKGTDRVPLSAGVSLGATASSIFGDPSSQGIGTQSVNLYSGQHNESFPLVSIPGRGGFGVSLSLEYNGNVSKVVRMENRKAQASAFGLGFDLGLESIIGDHRGTVDIRDDEYWLVMGGVRLQLIPRYPPNGYEFVVPSGRAWKIKREVATVGGMQCVIGWTIVREDGTTYTYGDLNTSLTGWNATRNVLRFGNLVGKPAYVGDTVFASAWDLKRIHDSEDLNWVEFTYTRDTAYMRVMNAAGDTEVNSDNAYTRASYLEQVETSDGHKIRLNYESRWDYQLWDTDNRYEFFQRRRIDEIVSMNSGDEVISHLEFEFDYLNSDLGNRYAKSILTSIRRVSPDGQDNLPPLEFIYDGDTQSGTVGSITSIIYPTGGVKELTYTELPYYDRFSILSEQIIDSAEGWWGTQGYPVQYLFASDNIFLDRSTYTDAVMGQWDGYWHTEPFPHDGENEDQPAVSPDGWAAVYDHGLGQVIIKRWSDGYFVTDTLPETISCDNAWMYPGKDRFYLLTGSFVNTPDGLEKDIDNEYYYAWDGQEWTRTAVNEGMGTVYLRNVELGNNVFVAHFRNADWVRFVRYGAYDPYTKTLDLGGETVGQYAYCEIASGPNWVAYSRPESVVLKKWSGSEWASWGLNGGIGNLVTALEALPNGIVWNVASPSGDNWTSYIRNTFFTPTGCRTTANIIGNSVAKVVRLWPTNHSLILQPDYNGSGGLSLDEWGGTNWLPGFGVSSSVDIYKIRMMNFSDAYYFLPSTDISANVKARRYLGNSIWSSSNDLDFDADETGAAPDYLLYCTGTQNRMYRYDPWFGGENYSSHWLQDLDVTDSYGCTGNDGKDRKISFFALPDNFYVENRYYDYDNYDERCNVYKDAFAFKMVRTKLGTQCKGRPPIYYVSSVKTYKYVGDPTPVIQDYECYGGLLDQSATTPRFSRVMVSTPYFAGGSPDGYSVSYFYNDIDVDEFYDPAIFTADPLLAVDLKDADLYGGVVNGGFRLDGMEYYSYTYTVDDPADKKQDYRRTFYSLSAGPSNVDGIYRSRVDSVWTRADSLESQVVYKYENYSNQVSSVRTRLAGGDEYLVDSTHYVHQDSIYIRMDNVLGLVDKKLSFYEASESAPDSILSFAGTEFEKHNGWKPVRTYTYRELNPLSDKIYTSGVLPGDESFDQWGNRISSTNAAGDTSCVKLNAAGTQALATAGNCYPNDFLAQGFEEAINDSCWDGWNLKIDEKPYVEIDSFDAFTGQYSYKMYDNANVDQKSWGAVRTILKDSLTTDKYYFSCWVKTNWIPMIYCWCNGTGTYKYRSYTNLEPGSWQKIEAVFDLSDLDWAALEDITLGLVMADNPDDGSYINFDDVRFHPLDAQVSTKTYDRISGVATSESGANNIPMKYSYDEFLRSLATLNHEGDTLSRKEYRLQESFVEEYVGIEIDDPSTGTGSDEVTLNVGQTVRYQLHGNADYLRGYTTTQSAFREILIEDPDECGPASKTVVLNCDQVVDYQLSVYSSYMDIPGKVWVYLNGAPVDSMVAPACPSSSYGPYSRSDSFSADAGDTVKIKADGGECMTMDSPDGDWRYYVRIDYEVMESEAGEGYARIFRNGDMIDEVYILESGNETKSGEFSADDDDEIKVEVYVYNFELDGEPTDTSWNFEAEAWYDSYIYDPDDPNYVKTVIYNVDYDPSVTMTFYDGLGKSLQSRTLDSLDGVERAIVTGWAELDARGRTLKVYKTYQDLWGSTGVGDYSPTATAVSEVGLYYDSDGPGVDCGDYPYYENVYTDSVKSRLHQSGAPGATWCIASGHAVTYEQETNETTQEQVSWTIDQDGLKTGTIADRWGEYVRSFSFLDGDSIVTISYKDKLGRDTAVFIDTSSASGADPILLRKAEYNDLGQVDSTWKVDYGTIRMIYDISGNLRFMQNDKRLAENNFVYFKYDALGRKIEEGLIDGADTNFTQTKACDRSFPDTLQGYEPEAKYRWYYDRYDNGDSVIVAPGKLVRVEDHKALYYKEFYRYPEQHYDITIVRMTDLTLALKAIRHDYNFDGSLKQLTVYPHWPDDSDSRVLSYEYERFGRLSAIVEDLGYDEYIRHVEYSYDVDGSLASKVLGKAHLKVGPGWHDDLAAVVDYRYDPRGVLTGIDDPSQVLSTLSGGGDIGDHFGLTLDFTFGDSAYYNGRLRRLEAGNSAADSVVFNNYTYTYNDLGWLAGADNTGNDDLDRQFEYNRLSLRTGLTTASEVIEYDYDDSEPGSSKLLWFTGMGSYEMKYDILGNMTADNSRNLYRLYYDYRNLVYATQMSSAASADHRDWMEMRYDEKGQRVWKMYEQRYRFTCEKGPDPLITSTKDPDSLHYGYRPELLDGQPMPVGGKPTDICYGTNYYHTYYLYDNGVLLATFDGDDEVIDLYVNGPGGMVASYHENDQELLYYYQTDQIGSPRVIVHSPGGTSQPEVAQYINYHPFGQVSQSFGSYDSPFKFTGKEQDNDRDFKFHYFGARYYDARIGMFSSIDKAGQFAGGYLYAGNNPILAADPDGNFAWFVPMLIGTIAGGYAGHQIGAAQGFSGWDLFWYTLGGAAVGGTSGVIGSWAGSAVGGGLSGGSVGGIVGGSSNAFGMGHLAGAPGGAVSKMTFAGGFSGFVGGTLSSAIGGYEGAFVGGAASGATGATLMGGGAEDALRGAAIGGSLGVASWGLETKIRFGRKTGNDVFDDSGNRDDISRAVRKSHNINKEEGGWLRQNHATERWPTGTATSIHPTTTPTDMVGNFHTHPTSNNPHSFADMRNTLFNRTDQLLYHLQHGGTAGPPPPCYVIARQNIYHYSTAALNIVTTVGAVNHYLMAYSYGLSYFGYGQLEY